MAPTPALTWNPSLTPQIGTNLFPAEYTPLQQFNVPNYQNVYDILFQGQGAQSPLGQSMLVPPDFQGAPAQNVIQQAAAPVQQAAPQQAAAQNNTSTGKAHGGSVNSVIDDIIAYLQHIRR